MHEDHLLRTIVRIAIFSAIDELRDRFPLFRLDYERITCNGRKNSVGSCRKNHIGYFQSRDARKNLNIKCNSIIITFFFNKLYSF